MSVSPLSEGGVLLSSILTLFAESCRRFKLCLFVAARVGLTVGCSWACVEARASLLVVSSEDLLRFWLELCVCVGAGLTSVA